MLNAFWGTGTLIGLSMTGFFAPRLGKKNQLGCIAVAVCFGLIILSDNSQSSCCKGRCSCSVWLQVSPQEPLAWISLQLKPPGRLETWGWRRRCHETLATVTGGAVLDLGKTFLTKPLLAYGLVLPTSPGMILAVWCLRPGGCNRVPDECQASDRICFRVN